MGADGGPNLHPAGYGDPRIHQSGFQSLTICVIHCAKAPYGKIRVDFTALYLLDNGSNGTLDTNGLCEGLNLAIG